VEHGEGQRQCDAGADAAVGGGVGKELVGGRRALALQGSALVASAGLCFPHVSGRAMELALGLATASAARGRGGQRGG
jgi:hypothetical protein